MAIFIFARRGLSDLECASDVILLIEDAWKLQVFSDRMNDSVGMRCTLSKCRLLYGYSGQS